MKIAFITPSIFTFGGEQRVLSMIAGELVKDHEVTVYTTDDIRMRANCPFRVPDALRVKHFLCKTGFLDWNVRKVIRVLNRRTGCFNTEKMASFMCDMYFPPRKRQELIDDINREQYDVVIAVSGHNSILLGTIADQISAKTIGWQHNSYEAYFETKGLYYWNQFYMFARAVKRLDHCFVLNHYIAQKYQENFGVDCDVFYNPRSFQSEIKASLQEPIFVACGEFNYRKGFDYLIEAFHEYVQLEAQEKLEKKWKLWMLGDGAMRSSIEQKLAEYQLKDRVVLYGNVKNVQNYLLQASCFVLSSRWEGFPMVETEALEIGLPTVAFDITALQPMVTDGREGLLAECYDCKAFAKRMLQMAKDDSLRRQMGRNAAQKSKEFSLDVIMKQWEMKLEEIISKQVNGL